MIDFSSRAAPVRALPSEADLQLLFAQLNAAHFDGALPGYRIEYNRRLRTVTGRVSYRPPRIELSTLLLAPHPGHIRSTLLHEMVHIFLHVNRLPSGHGAHFKRKMREVGLTSIYHEVPIRPRRSTHRYVLECPRCRIALLRKRRPGWRVSCARCSPRGFDPRVEFRITRRCSVPR